jgi:hypothetical protein
MIFVSETDLILQHKEMLGNSGKCCSKFVILTYSVLELYGQSLYKDTKYEDPECIIMCHSNTNYHNPYTNNTTVTK